MKKNRTALIAFVALLVGWSGAWLVRGAYDEAFMMEGHFHVVSSASRDHKVTLTFPSEEQVRFSLPSGGSYDFRQLDTGEGSVTVSVDGQVRDQVGYVTSSNGIVVMVIGDEEADFSQIFPSLEFD